MNKKINVNNKSWTLIKNNESVTTAANTIVLTGIQPLNRTEILFLSDTGDGDKKRQSIAQSNQTSLFANYSNDKIGFLKKENKKLLLNEKGIEGYNLVSNYYNQYDESVYMDIVKTALNNLNNIGEENKIILEVDFSHLYDDEGKRGFNYSELYDLILDYAESKNYNIYDPQNVTDSEKYSPAFNEELGILLSTSPQLPEVQDFVMKVHNIDDENEVSNLHFNFERFEYSDDKEERYLLTINKEVPLNEIELEANQKFSKLKDTLKPKLEKILENYKIPEPVLKVVDTIEIKIKNKLTEEGESTIKDIIKDNNISELDKLTINEIKSSNIDLYTQEVLFFILEVNSKNSLSPFEIDILEILNGNTRYNDLQMFENLNIVMLPTNDDRIITNDDKISIIAIIILENNKRIDKKIDNSEELDELKEIEKLLKKQLSLVQDKINNISDDLKNDNKIKESDINEIKSSKNYNRVIDQMELQGINIETAKNILNIVAIPFQRELLEVRNGKKIIETNDANLLLRSPEFDTKNKFAVSYNLEENGDIVEHDKDIDFFTTEKEAEDFVKNTILKPDVINGLKVMEPEQRFIAQMELHGMKNKVADKVLNILIKPIKLEIERIIKEDNVVKKDNSIKL